GASLFRGYYPDWRGKGGFATQDAGWLDERGHLHVSGRRDPGVITGGGKVKPPGGGAGPRGTGGFAAPTVFGRPGGAWGERAGAGAAPGQPAGLAGIGAAMARLLSPAKRPKRFIGLPAWPANAQGKVNRAEAARLGREEMRNTKQRSS